MAKKQPVKTSRSATARSGVAKEAAAKKPAAAATTANKPVASATTASKPATAKRAAAVATTDSATTKIDARIASLGDWRGETLARVRMLIRQADPDVVEEWKWDVPVWSDAGILCTGETYKTAVKLTFPKGASLPDPAGLFNASLAGGVRRAIDLHRDATIDASAFEALIRAAVGLNRSK
jgi:hypothetical protein